MQTPDANGFVYVNWPSKSVPHGGVFHTRIAEPTTENQQFLKVLLEESKLDIAHRRERALALRQAEAKPVKELPQVPQIRPRTSKRRSLSSIRESGIYEADPYRPTKRGEDREKLKERLAHFMAYGDMPIELVNNVAPPRKPKVPPVKLPSEKEKWHELVAQIRERADWLADMEALGEADEHRDIINEQIAQRMRMLDALGIDSEVSTARSHDSGFSTLRSDVGTIRSNKSLKSQTSATKIAATNRSMESQKKKSPKAGKSGNKEENVSSYRNIPQYQPSPRRRV